jgi:hypothetical protein
VLRRWRIKRTHAGTYRFGLADEERAVLRQLLPQLRELVLSPPEATDDRIRRLFPTAYADDPEKDAEYQRLMRDELVQSRVAAIDRVEASLDSTELSEDELIGWIQSVNAVRLVLGTMLDVHHKGRAVVSNGSREKAELDVFRLHEHGLWATMQRDGSDSGN